MSAQGRRGRLIGAACLGALLSACQPRVVEVQVHLVVAACQSPQPLSGATHLKLRVLGEGLTEPLETTASSSASEIKVADIPAGKGRVVEVRAYDADPAGGGRVVAIGRSLPVEIPSQVPADRAPITLNVFVRRVNSFTPPSSVDNPTVCGSLAHARAGHTATLLADGRVFLAGGYTASGGTSRTALQTTELFDPATGTFAAGPELGLINNQSLFTPRARAFHTATLLEPSGQVLLWGGEEYSSGDVNGSAPALRADGLLFDGETKSFLEAPQGASARSHHSAARDANGKVLVVGGRTRNQSSSQLEPADKVEWYDPTTNRSSVVEGAVLPRVDASVSAVQGGKFIAVAGGSNGTVLQDEVEFFQYVGTAFSKVTTSTPPRLRETRRSAAVASFRETNDLLLVGGYTDPTQVMPLASSEIVTTKDSFRVSEGPAVAPARGDICAALLLDGRVLMMGGRTVDEFGITRSDATVQVIVPQVSGPPTALGKVDLQKPRYFHTCTTMSDGTVLLAGGVSETNGTFQVLPDVQIYTPDPVD